MSNTVKSLFQITDLRLFTSKFCIDREILRVTFQSVSDPRAESFQTTLVVSDPNPYSLGLQIGLREFRQIILSSSYNEAVTGQMQVAVENSIVAIELHPAKPASSEDIIRYLPYSEWSNI